MRIGTFLTEAHGIQVADGDALQFYHANASRTVTWTFTSKPGG